MGAYNRIMKQHYNFKHGGYSTNKSKCVDCGVELGSPNSKRCMDCHIIYRESVPKSTPTYIDGRTLKEHFCKCGNRISYNTWSSGNGDCNKCANDKKRIYSKNNKCLDCKKSISKKAKRCYSCNSKFQHKSNPEHYVKIKIPKKKYFCIDCKKEKTSPSLRCHSCAIKERYRLYGVGWLSGENNYNWLGGKSFGEYGAEFDNSLKEQVRFRDGYKCKVCGCSQIENGKQLDCHHIDYDKKNSKLENLVALCMSCHRKTNYNREKWTEHFKNRNVSVTE